jgi:G:T-mismatch repair DNA endonuclease (very short patch repair protein)
VDWECGGRDKATCQRLIARLQRWRTRLYCTDDYAVYDVLLPLGQRYAGKDETHGIERDNARQRVITHACDGGVQALIVWRMVANGLAPLRRAVSTTVRMAASPEAAPMAR